MFQIFYKLWRCIVIICERPTTLKDLFFFCVARQLFKPHLCFTSQCIDVGEYKTRFNVHYSDVGTTYETSEQDGRKSDTPLTSNCSVQVWRKNGRPFHSNCFDYLVSHLDSWLFFISELIQSTQWTTFTCYLGMLF